MAFAQDIVFGKEVHKCGVHNVTENLPQITVYTDASVIIRVNIVSVFINWGYKSTIPDLREKTYTQNQIE